MGGFLGIGESAQEKALKQQKQLAAEEADRARRDAEIRQAERTAKKGQETANIELGGGDKDIVEDKEEAPVKSLAPKGPSQSLGLGGLGKAGGKKVTGVQL